MYDTALRQGNLQGVLSETTRTVPDCLDDGLDLGIGKNMESTTVSPNMCSEHSRLQTFQNWPSGWGQKLARYGFYGTSFCGDCTVRCAFCGLEISEISSPEDASLKHWQFALNYCRFLKGEDVGNVTIESQIPSTSHSAVGTHFMESDPEFQRVQVLQAAANRLSTQPTSGTPGDPPNHTVTSISRPSDSVNLRHQLTASQFSPTSQTISSSETKFCSSQKHSSGSQWLDIVRTARYPSMAPFQARLDTLSKWPLIKPSAQELAKAGLFHVKCQPSPSDTEAWISGDEGSHLGACQSAGKCGQDSVKCFWCGERIHRWKETDDAVLEHARLSPGCRFISHIIGQQLHQDIVSSSTSSPKQHIHRHHAERHHAVPSARPMAQAPLTSSELDKIMNSSTVQTVLQMGFPPQLIRDLLSHNSERLNAETLCHLALQTVQNTPSAPRPVSANHSAGNGREEFSELGQGAMNQVRLEKPPVMQSSGQRVTTSYMTEEFPLPSASLEGQMARSERVTCKVCADADVKVMFRPCNHLVCCKRCAALFTSCPVCHSPIEDILIPYLA